MPTTSSQFAEIIIPENADQASDHSDAIRILEGSAMFDLLPKLDLGGKHPREIVDVIDPVGHEWTFAFIFKPEIHSGQGQGKYLLTGIEGLMDDFNLKTGDTLIFEKEGRNTSVSYRRVGEITNVGGETAAGMGENPISGGAANQTGGRRVLKLGTRLRVISTD